MVGGIIKDLYIKKYGQEKHEVRILVQGINGDECNKCAVNVLLPAKETEQGVFKPTSPIWWQGGKVYITYNGVEDVPFEKTGFSSCNN